MAEWKGIVGRSFQSGEFDSYVAALHFADWKPEFVVLHNTAIPTLASWHHVSGRQRMNNLEAYYRDEQHWSAGPHLFVADDLICVFTPLTTSGIHSPSWNRVSWGVEMVGDYDQEPFGDAVRDNAVAALATLHEAAGLDPHTLHFHRDDPRTTHKHCPGKNVAKPDIIHLVVNLIAERAGNTSGQTPPGL